VQVVWFMTAAGMYALTSNGHDAAGEYSERYGTRCATGVIQRKRYDRVFSDDEDDEDDAGDDAERGRRALVRSRRNRTGAASDWDDARQERSREAPTKSASAGVLRASSSLLRYSRESSREPSDTETASNAASASGSDSGSDTEAYSEGSGPVRMTRSAAGGRPVVTNGHVMNRLSGGIGAKYKTRNQGRRTVHYEEADSDLDYDGREWRRTLGRRRTELGSRARLCRS